MDVARSLRGGRRPPRVATAAKPRTSAVATAAAAAVVGGAAARADRRAGGARATGNPLAIELALHASGLAGGGPLRLMARLMRAGRARRLGQRLPCVERAGARGTSRSGEYRPDHLALARELYAVHRAREGRAAYYYGYGADKTLDLSDCDSAQLWSLLDEAARLGVEARPRASRTRRGARAISGASC